MLRRSILRVGPPGRSGANLAATIPEFVWKNDRRGGPLVRQVQPVVEAVDGAVNGVLGVGERKPVLYFEDSNGDGRADLRRVVLTVDGGIPPSGQPEPGERRPEPLRPQTNP
jgi:hypothetical protein